MDEITDPLFAVGPADYAPHVLPGPRLPLLTLEEARDVVQLLLEHGESDSGSAWLARDVAATLAMRLPSE